MSNCTLINRVVFPPLQMYGMSLYLTVTHPWMWHILVNEDMVLRLKHVTVVRLLTTAEQTILIYPLFLMCINRFNYMFIFIAIFCWFSIKEACQLQIFQDLLRAWDVWCSADKLCISSCFFESHKKLLRESGVRICDLTRLHTARSQVSFCHYPSTCTFFWATVQKI